MSDWLLRRGRVDWLRVVCVGLTGLIVLAAIPLAVARWQAFDALGFVGVDLTIYRGFAQRFLDTGSLYLPSQLAGPFDPQPWLAPHLPSMYPPTAIYLFAPFLILPSILWWIVPLGIIGYVLWRWRPVVWSWPFLALLALNPDSLSGVISGNTTPWLVAFVAAGLRWSWPAVLVTLKPSLLPFALIGSRHRSWWFGMAVLGVVSLPLAAEWIAYGTVVWNAETTLLYSLGSVPPMFMPLVAWLGRTSAAAGAPRARAPRAADPAAPP